MTNTNTKLEKIRALTNISYVYRDAPRRESRWILSALFRLVETLVCKHEHFVESMKDCGCDVEPGGLDNPRNVAERKSLEEASLNDVKHIVEEISEEIFQWTGPCGVTEAEFHREMNKILPEALRTPEEKIQEWDKARTDRETRETERRRKAEEQYQHLRV